MKKWSEVCAGRFFNLSDPRELDLAIIWQETSEKLAKHYAKEGFTYIDILKVMICVVDLFEKKLYQGDEEK